MVRIEEARILPELDRGGRLAWCGKRHPLDPAQHAVHAALREQARRAEGARPRLQRWTGVALQRACSAFQRQENS